MFRKHFRFRRMLLGFAFAAMAVPVTPALGATGAFADGGPMPVSTSAVTSFQPSYLRYHEVGYPVGAGPVVRSENARSVSTITPLQADGLRWTAMAQRYQQLQGTAAISERSNGVKGPDPSLVPQVVLATTDNGFSWADAGIGASSVFGATLLLGLGIALTRRNQHSGLTRA